MYELGHPVLSSDGAHFVSLSLGWVEIIICRLLWSARSSCVIDESLTAYLLLVRRHFRLLFDCIASLL